MTGANLRDLFIARYKNKSYLDVTLCTLFVD